MLGSRYTSKVIDLFADDPALVNCWTIHAAFSRLGFPSKDVYVVIQPEIMVMVIADNKQFTVNMGPYVGTSKEFAARWQYIAKAIADGHVPDDVLQELWKNSAIRQNAVPFAASLHAKGIRIPKIDNTNPARDVH